MRKNLNLKLISLFLSTFSFLTTTTFLNNNKSYAMENNPTYQQSYDASKSEFQKQIESAKKILSDPEIKQINQQAEDLTKFEERNYPGYYSKIFERNLTDFDRSVITEPSTISSFLLRPENLPSSNNISSAVRLFNEQIFLLKDKIKKIETKVNKNVILTEEDCVTKDDLKQLELHLKNLISFVGKYISEMLKYKYKNNNPLFNTIRESMIETLLDNHFKAFMNKEKYVKKTNPIKTKLTNKTIDWIEKEFSLPTQDLNTRDSVLNRCAFRLLDLNQNEKEFEEYKDLIKLIYNDLELYLSYITKFMAIFYPEAAEIAQKEQMKLDKNLNKKPTDK